MKGSFKTALIAAVVSALVAAGASVATTQTFVLGTTNTVDAASTVTAGATGLNAKLLQLTNNSTGSSATALGLTTPSSRPPMIVSSGAKVANLNADLLDNLDSKAFLKAQGYNNVATINAGQTTTLLASPYFTDGFTCRPQAQGGGARIGFTNRYNGEAQVFNEPGPQFRTLSPPGGGTNSFAIITPQTARLTYDIDVATVMASLDIWVVNRGADCYAAAHAVILPETPGAP